MPVASGAVWQAWYRPVVSEKAGPVNERLDVSGPSHPDHLFTWLDVNLYFAALARQGRWPGWLREIDAYWDGVRVSVAPLTPPDDVWHWLREVLGPLTVEPARADRRKLPFTLESVGLTAEQAQLLDANGVVFREADHYWIPEIFRHGLGFDVAGGRRPRVIAVANLVRRRNDILG